MQCERLLVTASRIPLRPMRPEGWQVRGSGRVASVKIGANLPGRGWRQRPAWREEAAHTDIVSGELPGKPERGDIGMRASRRRWIGRKTGLEISRSGWIEKAIGLEASGGCWMHTVMRWRAPGGVVSTSPMGWKAPGDVGFLLEMLVLSAIQETLDLQK